MDAVHRGHLLSLALQIIAAEPPVTPPTAPMWMLLLLDVDQNGATGWLGYDYIVNHPMTGDASTSVGRWEHGAWQTIGRAAYRVDGNALELHVPRDLVGARDGDPTFDFHWADNIQSFAGVAELAVNGDSAPHRRWNYRFQVDHHE